MNIHLPKLIIAITWISIATARLPAVEIDFSRDIRPLLSDHCFQCHGPDEKQRQANLRLDVQEGIFGFHEGGAIVTPGKPLSSELIRRITSSDATERMPPVEFPLQLTVDQIAQFRSWIANGAPWAEHWSFETLQASGLPNVDNLANWARNAIDRFVLAKAQQSNFTVSVEATREQLLRRVTIDLTGLPPTLEEIDLFLVDESPHAYQRVVDRLLASPRYGERMAWEWLDAARYADTNGFQGDSERTMWPWRDWVIQALNANLAYDQFTIEQLAGDLLTKPSLQQRLATGFCRNHMINGEGGRIAEENRVEYIFDQIETLGTIWLGLTVGCARCHDHKYDPIQQQDYYRLFAFFNQTSVNGAGGSPKTPPILDVPTDQQQKVLLAQIQELGKAVANVVQFEISFFPRPPEEPVSHATNAADLPDTIKQILDVVPAQRKPAQLSEIEKHFRDTAPDYAEILKHHRESAEKKTATDRSIPRVMVMQDKNDHRKTFILERGLYNQRKQEVTAGVPSFLHDLSDSPSRNRLDLARWLFAPENPLTARVTVNRHWQTFFGNGLVKTTEDFGVQGEKPSHPEMLDWLAMDLRRSGWNVKSLHRLIVTSSTYRQSAQTAVNDPQNQRERDPDNRWLTRGPRFRMPSWMIRDHALAASGLLVSELGGPPVRPYQPSGVWAEATFGKKRYKQHTGSKLHQRSLYTFWRRIVGPTFFFDTSKRQTCSVKIARTNTPLHALTTLNDTTYVEAARVMAEQIQTIHAQSAEAGIREAFRRVTSRRPNPEELQRLVNRWNIWVEHFTSHREDALQFVSNGQSPLSDRFDTAEYAAHTAVCLLILNLDEGLTR